MQIYKFVLVAALFISSTAQADVHLGVESMPLEWAVVHASRAIVGDTRELRVGGSALGLRAGHLWEGGLELGGLLALSFTRLVFESDHYSSTQVSPAVYLRYLWPGERARLFVGAQLGVDLTSVSDSPGGVAKGNYFGSGGVEVGVRVPLIDWLSVDPFVRYRVSRGSLEGGDDVLYWTQTTHRLSLGIALSAWL